MSNEIRYRHTNTGVTLYSTLRKTNGQYWNNTTLQFNDLNTTEWYKYPVSLTENPASSYFYQGNWPATLTSNDWYWVDFFQMAGASGNVVDPFLDTYILYWNGTNAEIQDTKQVDNINVGSSTPATWKWISTRNVGMSSSGVGYFNNGGINIVDKG